MNKLDWIQFLLLIFLFYPLSIAFADANLNITQVEINYGQGNEFSNDPLYFSDTNTGQTVFITVYINNLLATDVNATVGVLLINESGTYINPGGAFQNKSVTIYSNNPATEVTFNWTINTTSTLPTGIYNVSVFVTYPKNATYNETKVDVSQYIKLIRLELIDFYIRHTDADFTVGDEVEFIVSVMNPGTVSATADSEMLIKWLNNVTENKEYEIADISAGGRYTVEPGETKNISFTWVPTQDGCDYADEEDDWYARYYFYYGWSRDPNNFLLKPKNISYVHFKNEYVTVSGAIDFYELAPGDPILGLVDVSNFGDTNATIHEVKGWLEDENGNRIMDLTPHYKTDINISRTGEHCASSAQSVQYSISGTLPETLSPTTNYHIAVGVDHGVPRGLMGYSYDSYNGFNDYLNISFEIVKANLTEIYAPDEVAYGVPVTVNVEVENIGVNSIDMSPRVTLKIYNNTFGYEVNYTRQKTLSVGEKSNQTFENIWTPIKPDIKRGLYLINASYIYGYGGISKKIKEIEVVELTAENTSATPVAPYESTTITAQVKNEGPTNVTLNSIEANIKANGNNIYVGSINNTEISTTHSFNFTYYFDSFENYSNITNGSFPIWLKLSYGGTQFENTLNNITLLPVGIKSFNVPSSGVNGTPFTVTVTLTNIGNSDVNVTLNLTANGTQLNATSVNATKNGDTTVNFNVTLTNGTYIMKVTANYSGLPELIERNDTINIFVVGPELEISSNDIDISPSSPTQGDTVTINATVHNTGPVDASNFLVELIIDGNSTKNNTLSVAAGSTNTTQFTWQNVQAGTHNITIIVDPSDEVTGENETNNVASVLVSISAPAAPTAVAVVGGGPGPEVVIKEGINDWTTNEIAKWLKDEGLLTATFVDAPKELSGTLLSVGEYPAPEEDYLRKMLKRPIQELDVSTSSQGWTADVASVDSASTDVYEIAANKVLKKFTFTNTLIIARGDLPVDSMSAVAYARTNNLPILITKPERLPDATFEAAEKLKPKKILVVGGEIAVSEKAVRWLKEIAPVERIWGENRYETAVKMAEKIENPRTVVITDGENPNVLAAVIAAKYRVPLLYVTSFGIPDATRDYLKIHKFTKFYNRPLKVIIIGVEKPVVEEITELMKTEKWGAQVEVRVRNNLDKGVFIDLYVDEFVKIRWVEKGTLEGYGVYDVSTGKHVLKLRWLDPDTRVMQEKSTVIELKPGEKLIKTLSIP